MHVQVLYCQMAVAKKTFQFSLAEKGLALLLLPALVQIILTSGLLAVSIANRISVANSLSDNDWHQITTQYALSCHAILEDVRASVLQEDTQSVNDPLSFNYVLSFGKNLTQLRKHLGNPPMQMYAQELQLAAWAANPPETWTKNKKLLDATYSHGRLNFLWLAETQRQRPGHDPTYRSQERLFWLNLLTALSIAD